MASLGMNDVKNGQKILVNNDPCVITDTEYVKPGKGPCLYAEAEQLSRGQSTCLYRVSVYDERHTLIAYMTGNGFFLSR